MKFRSDLAIMTAQPRDVSNRKTARAFGVLVHTTGVGVLSKAEEWGCTPIKAAERIYTERGASFAHYVIGQDGTIVQIADEREMAWQSGMPKEQRQLYKSGAWEKMVTARGLELWKKRWPGIPNPSELYPSGSPNNDYIGIEMIPNKNTLFSATQLEVALPSLAADIIHRHSMDFDGTMQPTLLGHEDIEPLERWNKQGGWDPGTLRDTPKFEWQSVYKIVSRVMGEYERNSRLNA